MEKKNEESRGLTSVIRFLLYISPFFFPTYLIRFKISGIPVTVLELFIYALFLLWVLSLARPKLFYFKNPLSFYWAAAGLIFLGASFGILKAPAFMTLPDGTLLNTTQAALGIWKGWVIAPLLYFLVLTQSFSNPSQLKKMLRYFVVSAALIALIAYGMGLFGLGITPDLRLHGFYESANALAMILVPALLLNLAWFFEKRSISHFQHYVDTATLTVLLHALFFTQSYAGILAVFGSLFLYGFYGILRRPASFKKTILGMGILFVVLGFMTVTQFNAPKFRQFLDTKNQSSTTVRFEIYRVTWNLIEKKWLWGVGPGLYQAHYQTRAPEVLGRPPLEWNVPHPHNLFFAFWLNAGLLGLLGLLGFIWLAHQRFAYPLLAFWGILLHGFFDTPFWKNDLAMIFWVIVAAIALLQSYGTASAQKPASKTRSRSASGASRRLKASSTFA